MEKISMRHDDVYVLTRVLYANEENALYKDSEFTRGVSSEELVDVFDSDVCVKFDKDGNETTAKAVELVGTKTQGNVVGTVVAIPEDENITTRVYINHNLSEEKIKTIVFNALDNATVFGEDGSYIVIGFLYGQCMRIVEVSNTEGERLFGIISSGERTGTDIVIYSNVPLEHSSNNMGFVGWNPMLLQAFEDQQENFPDGYMFFENNAYHEKYQGDANHLLTELFSSTPFTHGEGKTNYTLIAGMNNEFYPVD